MSAADDLQTDYSLRPAVLWLVILNLGWWLLLDSWRPGPRHITMYLVFASWLPCQEILALVWAVLSKRSWKLRIAAVALVVAISTVAIMSYKLRLAGFECPSLEVLLTWYWRRLLVLLLLGAILQAMKLRGLNVVRVADDRTMPAGISIKICVLVLTLCAVLMKFSHSARERVLAGSQWWQEQAGLFHDLGEICLVVAIVVMLGPRVTLLRLLTALLLVTGMKFLSTRIHADTLARTARFTLIYALPWLYVVVALLVVRWRGYRLRWESPPPVTQERQCSVA